MLFRSKRTLRAGERTLHALARGGVEYVEVRALDNSTFDPVGVNLRKLYFLEAFVQLLLLRASPPIEASEEEEIDRNHLIVARRGRDPALTLTRDGRAVPMRAWAHELLDSMQGVCELLDAGHAQRPYTATLKEQLAKLQEVELTPSARLLRELRQHDESFSALALRFSIEHRRLVEAAPVNEVRQREFEREAEESLQTQQRLEETEKGSFEDYLAAYLAG